MTSIENYAFSDCAGLTSVTVPENVTSIGLDAFRNCTGLTSVCFQGNAPKIGSNVFQLYDESIYRFFNIPGLTLYFIEGKDGWTTPTWGTEKYPTATWDGVNVPQPPHQHVYTVAVTAPTCTEQGYTTHTCVCGDSYKDTYTAALGHDYYAAAGSDATCTAAAWTEYNCSRCADHYRVEGARTRPRVERWRDHDARHGRAARCENLHLHTLQRDKDGGASASDAHARLFRHRRCSNLHDRWLHDAHLPLRLPYKDTFTAALGHDYYAAAGSDATCTAAAWTEYNCSRCGDHYRVEGAPALGHAWNDGEITTPATEEQPGVKTYTCTRCSATRTEELPPLTHTHVYSDTVVAPTCMTVGYTTHTCRCGYSYKGHLYRRIGAQLYPRARCRGNLHQPGNV